MPACLSIITPVKNAEKWLEECIQSVLQQDFKDWEWIFVDDHSDDSSASIIASHAAGDERIKLFYNPSAGILPALEIAMEISQGQYITRMDADDIMPEARLHKFVNAIKAAPEKSIITGLVQYFSATEISAGYLTYEQWLNKVTYEEAHWKNIYRECVVASPNWIMRRSELEAIEGFSGLTYPEDYDLVFRWYQHKFKIKSLPELCLYWREHPERTSRNSDDYHQRAFFRLKLRRFAELDYKPEKQLLLWGSGTKARLASGELKKLGVPHTRMFLTKKTQDQSGLLYTAIDKFTDPQVLLAIYPPSPQRRVLESFLHLRKLYAGEDYWYL